MILVDYLISSMKNREISGFPQPFSFPQLSRGRHNAMRKILLRAFSTARQPGSAVKLHSFPFSSPPSVEVSPHPLVFLHGLLGNSLNWRSVGQKFPRHRAIGVDLRNHGNSPHQNENSYASQCEDLHAFLSSFSPSSPVHLCGHSMGGKVAMAFALKFPDRVKSLTVVDMTPFKYSPTAANWLGVGKVLKACKMVRLEGVQNKQEIEQQLKASIEDTTLRGFLMQNIISNPSGSPLYRWRLNLDVLYDFLHSGTAADFPFPLEDFPPYRGPVNFLGGETSDYILPDHYSTMKAYFPQYSLEIIEKAGHWIHFDNPRQLIEKIQKFLEKAENHSTK